MQAGYAPKKNFLIFIFLLTSARITQGGDPSGEACLSDAAYDATAFIIDFPRDHKLTFSKASSGIVPFINSDLARTIQSLEWESIQIKKATCLLTHRGIVEIELDDLTTCRQSYHQLRFKPFSSDEEEHEDLENLIKVYCRDIPRSPYNHKAVCLRPSRNDCYVIVSSPQLSYQKDTKYRLVIISANSRIITSPPPKKQDIVFFHDINTGALQITRAGNIDSPLPETEAIFEPWFTPATLLRSRIIDWLGHQDEIPPLYQPSFITITTPPQDKTTWDLDCHRTNGRFQVTSPLPDSLLIKRKTKFDRYAIVQLPDFTFLPQQRDMHFVDKNNGFSSLNISHDNLKRCCKDAFQVYKKGGTVQPDKGFKFTSVTCAKCNNSWLFGKSMLSTNKTKPSQSNGTQDPLPEVETPATLERKLQMTGYQMFGVRAPAFLPFLAWSECDSSLWCIAMHFPCNGMGVPKRLSNPTALSSALKIKIGLSLIRAIGYFHQRERVHLNLRLSDIYYDSDCSSMYLANPGYGYFSDTVPITCLPCQQVSYMVAPELILGGCSDGKSLDLWQLGSALHNLFSPITRVPAYLLQGGGFDPKPFLVSPEGKHFLYLCAELLSCHPAERPETAAIIWNLPEAVLPVYESLSSSNESPFRPGHSLNHFARKSRNHY
ncbi:hypothetical protein ACWJJH_21525 [Endozoicomonadaceae bacterium StTr2]